MLVICKSLPIGYAKYKLTIGKQYEVIDGGKYSPRSYRMTFDDGSKNTIDKRHFLNVSYLRNKKLEEIGII